MVETPFTGLTASVAIGSGPSALRIGYISGFDLTLEKTIIEIMQFGSTYMEKVPAIKDWSASTDGTLAIAKGGSQERLYKAFEDGSPLTFTIRLDARTYFVGTGYVSSFNISGAPDDALTLSSDIAGSGAVLLHLPDVSVITDLATQAAQANQVGLTWTPPVGVTMQEVQQSLDEISWTLSTTETALTATTTTASVINLEAGTKYFFRVRAIGGDNAGFSNIVNATTTTA